MEKPIFNELIGSNVSFVQENHSKSKKNVLRGLHYQIPPNDQDKLVRCISGEIFDVIVDIRKSSKSFLSWAGILLEISFISNYGYHQALPMDFIP